jgi:D-alanine-D-alanine ligase
MSGSPDGSDVAGGSAGTTPDSGATAADGGARVLAPVTVLLGGPSAEHDVSLVSGRAIAAALTERGHDVDAWLIDLERRWWWLPPDARRGDHPPVAYDRPRELGADGPCTAAQALERIASAAPRRVAFLALHGPYGEDGTVQALCESAGIVYTGAGVAASALGMDKVLFKRVVSASGIPVLPWRSVSAGRFRTAPDAVLQELRRFAASESDPRLITKPARLGSSVGIRIVHDPLDDAELSGALEEAFRFDDLALVEAYLAHARELEASVVGNDAESIEVYGPGEVFPGHEFYDYTAKYVAGVSHTTDSPELDPVVRDRVRALARETFLAIGGEGFARVDFLARDEALYVSEINTIPGFTPISLFPVLCAEGGYDFGAISARIVDLALEREDRGRRRSLSREDLP